MTQVGKLLAGMLGLALRAASGENHRAARHRKNQIVALRPVLVVAQAHSAARSHTMRHETVIQQAGRITAGHEDHGASIAAIAAIRPGQRLVLLTTDAGGTVAAIAALDMDGYSIHKITHYCCLCSSLLTATRSGVRHLSRWESIGFAGMQVQKKPRP